MQASPVSRCASAVAHVSQTSANCFTANVQTSRAAHVETGNGDKRTSTAAPGQSAELWPGHSVDRCLQHGRRRGVHSGSRRTDSRRCDRSRQTVSNPHNEWQCAKSRRWPHELPAIAAASASGTAIEINTSGWHKDCNEQYPARQFLDIMHEAGIDLVISSDAHCPADVGRDFEKAVCLARDAGFTQSVRFEKRSRTLVDLPSATST